MDPEAIAETLEALATKQGALATAKRIRCLRGVRGTPHAEIAHVAVGAWEEEPPQLPEDADALSQLFGMAWEDGLVAVGLLAALAVDEAEVALELALEWAPRVDDVETADALGWLVLGPTTLVRHGAPLPALDALLAHRRPEVRRAVAAAGMALTPTRLEGPSAAALKARLGTRQVRFVEDAMGTGIASILDATWRDEGPPVRKAVRRLLRAWTTADRGAAVAWAAGVGEGLPRMLRDVVEPPRKKKPRRRR